MFDNIFGIHEQALLLHGQRLGVLATNLANADTPNYKARDIDFAEVLGASGEAAPLAAQRHAGGAHRAASTANCRPAN
jgi:flagellar basal-body rod protein FlgB